MQNTTSLIIDGILFCNELQQKLQIIPAVEKKLLKEKVHLKKRSDKVKRKIKKKKISFMKNYAFYLQI